MPTPIAQGVWKVTAPDGREELTYQPIPGFEHLWHGQGQGQPHTPTPPSGQPTVITAAHPSVPCQLQQPHVARRKSLKRSRSETRKLAQEQSHAHLDDDEDDDGCDPEDRSPPEKAHTFYIGDFDELCKFFRRRLEELTMKPLRPIVTAWIKQLEPRRLGSYGPYHKKMPSQRPPECTPEWWPRDVRYEEPSHLDKAGLLKVAVTMMLQHRAIDEPKRKGSWVAKLQQAAQYAIETTPPEQFSSSKGSGFSERMRDRALNEIMPSLFSIAQIYEDHLARNNLYEGSGNVDTREGTMCTWQPVSRPPRQSTFNRKRAKVQSRASRRNAVSDENFSGDETEVDESVANSFMCRQVKLSQSQQRIPNANNLAPAVAPAPVPVPGTVLAPTLPLTVSTTPLAPYVAATPAQNSSITPSPNTSFDRTMTQLRLDDEADIDVKYVNSGEFNNTNMMCNMFALSQAPMHYSTSQPCFSTPGFHGQELAVALDSPAQSPFVTEPPYPHYTMFNMSYPQPLDNAVFAPPAMDGNHHGYPYDYDVGYPAAVDGVDAVRPFPGPAVDLKSTKSHQPSSH